MNYGKISIRYAKALFLQAKEEGSTESVFNDLNLLAYLIENEPTLKDFLNVPIIKPSEKINFLVQNLGKHLQPLTLKFLELLCVQRRENYLSSIIRSFLDLYFKDKNLVKAKLYTAYKLDNSTISNITKKLEETIQKNIQLEEKINPDLIGGFVLQLEDKEFDGSVKNQLNKIKNTLIQSKIN